VGYEKGDPMKEDVLIFSIIADDTFHTEILSEGDDEKEHPIKRQMC
jgi:hypothetical protein